MQHPVYTSLEVQSYQSQLEMVNDFYLGIDEAAEYLIQYTREDTDTFKKRLRMATLDNYVRRAVVSIRDIIFRKPINTSAVETTSFGDYLNKIDLQNNLTDFAKQLTINAAKDGFTFLLVEKEPYEDVATQADALTKRPYFVNITRDRVRNWLVDEFGTFEMITIDESYVESAGLYSRKIAIQQRVYFNDGRVEIWRTKGKKYFKHQEIQTGLDFIPIVKIGRDDLPPFYDLAKLNANHMNLISEQRNYARIAAAPIPVMYMPDNNEGKVVTVGVSDGISFSGPKRDAGFEWMELKGTNNTVLNELIDRDEANMRTYLSELLSTDTVKTAKEVGVLNTGNESRLGHYAEIVESGLNEGFRLMAIYQGDTSYDAQIGINRDYFDKRLTDAEVTAYKAMYAENVISWETLMQLLIDGEILPPMTEEEIATEKARLSAI